jgi:hypothetical protein
MQVREKDIAIFMNRCSKVEKQFGVPVTGFIGGPVFDPSVIQVARKAGLRVLRLSGNRFRIDNSEDQSHYAVG